MSDKDIEHRISALEKNFHAIKATLIENGRTIDKQMTDNRLTLAKLDKKLDRVLTVAVQTATEMNLHRQRDIHLEESCHPAQKINDHLKWHDEQKQEAADVQESKGRRAARQITLFAAVSAFMVSVGKLIFDLLLGRGSP